MPMLFVSGTVRARTAAAEGSSAVSHEPAYTLKSGKIEYYTDHLCERLQVDEHD